MSKHCKDCTFMSEENKRLRNIVWRMYLALDPHCTGLDYEWMVKRTGEIVRDLEEERLRKPADIACKVCKGTGMVDKDSYSRGQCPVCNGTGRR
jgi:DnaJ-class molecular chaperone